MPLTNEQSSQYTRMERVDLFLDDKQTTVDAYTPMKVEVSDFKNNLAALVLAMPEKNVVSTGITIDKKQQKQKVAKAGEFICHLTHLFADKFGHPKLAAAVNLNYDKIYKAKDADIVTLAKGIVDAVTPYVANVDFKDYAVTQAKLDGLTKLASDFASLIGVAKVDNTGNAIADTEIDRLIGLMIKNIERMDKAMVFYEETDPKFVEGYHLNSTLEHNGVRHNGMDGLVKDAAGELLADVTVTLKGTHYEAKSDLYGAYHLSKVQAGDYVVVVSAKGYVTQEFVIHISPKKMLERNFVLS